MEENRCLPDPVARLSLLAMSFGLSLSQAGERTPGRYNAVRSFRTMPSPPRPSHVSQSASASSVTGTFFQHGVRIWCADV